MAVRAAIVGCGDIGRVHAAILAGMPGVDIVGVCDVVAERRDEFARALGVPAFADHRALLESGSVDVVHVTTPHHQHLPVTLDALAAGVHVLQEKPLAPTLTDAERLVAAGASARGKFGVCYQNRYNPASVRVRELLESGALGEVRGAYASVVWARTPDYYSAKPWRGRRDQAGGGLLINQAIHTLDLLQWWLGEPVEVAATVATLRYGGQIDIEDTASVLYTHPGGVFSTVQGALTVSRHRPVEIELDCANAHVVVRDGLTITWADGRVEAVDTPSGSGPRSYWGNSHSLLIADFYARLDDPEPFWIGPEEAIPSLRMVAAAYAAAGPGRELSQNRPDSPKSAQQGA